ncbi:MAG: nucleotide excision repair endonuclease, partial [Pirellulaceae bacterium]|nr:nucleotide excision repair endonuclease [Pirellulaceae bacterium]
MSDLPQPPPEPADCQAPLQPECTSFEEAAARVRQFPQVPGVYLMKNRDGLVIYIGKAVNLRSRVGSYFTAAAAQEVRTAGLVPEIRDVEVIETDSEV